MGKVAVEGLKECLDFSALIHYELNFSEAECLYFQIFSVYLSSFDMSDIVIFIGAIMVLPLKFKLISGRCRSLPVRALVAVRPFVINNLYKTYANWNASIKLVHVTAFFIFAGFLGR